MRRRVSQEGGVRNYRLLFASIAFTTSRWHEIREQPMHAYMKRIVPITLLFVSTFVFAPTKARAEILTLDCTNNSGWVYVIDLSARTATIRVQGTSQDVSNVVITDSIISFVVDRRPAYRTTVRIDRVTGKADFQNYYYPEGHVSGTPYFTNQCRKLPNQAF